MKDLGIVRSLDSLGRITIPIELRRTLGIEEGDPMEIFVEGSAICIKAVKLQCVICGSTEESKLVVINGVHICNVCTDAVIDATMKD